LNWALSVRRVRFFVMPCSSGIGPQKGSRSRSTTFASVPISPTTSIAEDRAFFGDAVNVGRVEPHHAVAVGADVPHPDVVTHDDEDIGLLLLCRHRTCDQRKRRGQRK